jgi:hypothetical protein
MCNLPAPPAPEFHPDTAPASDLARTTDPALAPDPQALAAWRAELACAAENPWFASMLMARLDGLRVRLDELRRWLTGLTRTQRRVWGRRLALATPAALVVLALAGGPAAHAANITVDAGVVVIAADGDCSLREAIINANNDAATHADCAAGSGADTIILPAASTFTVTDIDNTTDGENGLPSVTSAITIDGNGSIIERDPMSADTFRLFHVAAATGDLTLDATTVRFGVADDAPDDVGGGIFSLGPLAITNGSVISGNTATDGGGGVAVLYSSLTITGSTISGNTASGMISYGGGGVLAAFSTTEITNSTISGNSGFNGGGVNASRYGSLNIDHSTIADNTATYGGGVGVFFNIMPGAATLTNSTISGNSAAVFGGGIAGFLSAALGIRNSTVTANSAPDGAGIAFLGGPSYLTNTIVADQVAGADCFGGGFTSQDFNLDSDSTCGLIQPNDIPGGNANLGPLALNAPGTTETHALLAGSDALDNGDCSGGTVTDDQRTVLRPQGPACDIGAYELVPPPTPTPAPPTAATLAGFTARQDRAGRVTLAWETASEAEVVGFNVERAAVDPANPAGPWVRVNDALIPADGSAAGGADYRFVDDARGLSGSLRYRLEVIGSSGTPQTFGPIDAVRRLFEAVLPWVRR